MTTDAAEAPVMAYEYAVALTGGIATGKSTASTIFRALGFAVIDADTIAHEILDTQHEQIAERFGAELVHRGRIDRRALGRIVFADARRLQELEALLHPLIQEEIARRAGELDALGEPYFIDIPLFYEKAAYPIERVVAVYAPRSLQIKRLMDREGLGEAEALQRLDAQIDIEDKRHRATWVIENTNDLTHLQNECERIAAQIKM
jgi:dephospho-CoA kinase